MNKVLGSSWMVLVNGNNVSGLQREDYCRDLFETTAAGNPSGRVQLVRVDRVATDFATTGRNWKDIRVVVEDTKPSKSAAEHARDAAYKAAVLNVASTTVDPRGEVTPANPYYNDAAMLLLSAFRRAQGEKRLDAVVAGFERLADNEPYRVHKMLISLKRGRESAVLNALVEYAGR